MSDVMRIQPLATQLRRILAEFELKHSIFDIHASLFYTPGPDAPYALDDVFGRRLATPVGPSAGPHTQLSQNIVSAFLCGGRFIELKTVQLKDDLVIPRPCIDMTDEGYNVEWSQELTLEESVHEYVVGWALVHLLPRILGWDAVHAGTPDGPGVIFDMSVGYDLAGITHPRMTRFMDILADASEHLAPVRDTIAREFPQFADVPIPDAIVNSVTLSTMHGCPPEEIERIARFLMTDRRLHTVVKLNPTLLGKARVLDILHRALGFHEIEIPDRVFEHDLRYEHAVGLITRLKSAAAGMGVSFGVKLSNTLAMQNHTGRLPGDEMYMSGRALYPVTMGLYDRLLHEFDGDLRVSFSAGVDAANVATVLQCGAMPVTGCTDLLKPGGYGRMTQWLSNLDAVMRKHEAGDLAAFSADKLAHVSRAAAEALTDPRYKKQAFPHGLPKVASGLGLWDCVVAPCVEACAVEQDVPEYAWLIAQADYDNALEVILARNPLPGITGYVCNALCQTRCTRNDYEETVAIRALKRIAEERGHASYVANRRSAHARRVAIVGSGPSGLAAAAFLALNGIHATIFEARDRPGGMMRTIPPFRLPDEIIQRDIDRILELGVEIVLNTRISDTPEHLLAKGFDAVYLAAGFQRETPLRVPGVEGPGVMPALRLLDRSRRGEPIELGTSAVVIGGGDTAMDAARTAQRITGRPVTILYRRTRHEMPAAEEELAGALAEGNVLQELVAPLEIVRVGGLVTAIRCIRTALGEAGPDGRRSPVEIPGSAFEIPCDTVIVAIGQLPDLAFLEGSGVSMHRSGGVQVDAVSRSAGPAGVYAGGDMVVEPSSIISACADGRKAAEAICRQLGITFAEPPKPAAVLSDEDLNDVRAWRARRVDQVKPQMLRLVDRNSFTLIESTFTEDEARREALRCVQCSTICDKCVEVCPNRANYTFTMQPVAWQVPIIAAGDDGPRVTGTEAFRVEQVRQILHVDDFCNECDNCQTFCVHHGKPYVDKPRLFLDPVLFAAESHNAFFIDGRTMTRREQDGDCTLTVDAAGVTFDDGTIRVRASRDWTVTDLVVTAPFEGTRSLRPAAEMLVLYDGITRTLPFLLMR
jgi:putative selenate reductase